MDYLRQIELLEKGDAETFAELFNDKLIFDHTENTWYKFNGHIWEEDSTRHVYNLVERVAKVYEETASLKIESISEKQFGFYRSRINKLRKKAGIKNTLELATAKMPLTKKWDSNPYLLAVKNGVIDLETGKLLDGKPEHYIRNCSEVEFKGLDEPCPRWEQFLNELFPDNPEIIEFLQRMFGYSISGLNVEHIFALFYGKRGRNGKDVMLETISNVLGESLSGPISKEVLLSGLKNPGASAPFLYELQGKRLVYSDETGEGAAFDSAQVKMLSGGAPFIAKKLYAQPTVIVPQYLIVITSNDKPVVDADDDALWERLICIEYTQRFVDNPTFDNEHPQDKFLKQKLAKEHAGILAWLVKGFLMWKKDGLKIPQSVMYKTDEYRNEQDSLGRFIDNECIVDTMEKVSVTTFYKSYSTWADADGQKKLSRREFSRKVEEKFAKERYASGYFYIGINVKNTPDNDLDKYLDL